MSEFNKHVQDALRTEGTIEEVIFDKKTLITVMKLFIASGTLLDHIKKKVFYNRPINSIDWMAQSTTLKALAKNLDKLNSIDPTDESINIDSRMFHSIVGIATEGTELIEAVVKAVENDQPIDEVNVREEYFDTFWYLLFGHDVINKDVEGTLKMGFDKLKARYPEKFTDEAANNRDLDTERAILEKGHNE